MQAQTIKSVSLVNTQGSRDAEYHCQIVTSGSGYVLNYQNGRRGSTLTPGTKTATPVELSIAEKAFDKLVKEKKGKGYRPINSSEDTAYAQSSNPEEQFQVPQLLNEIKPEDIEKYLDNDAWGMMEKMDGQRKQVSFNRGEFKISNKLAKATSVPKLVTDQVCSLVCDIEMSPIVNVHLDAELVGNTLYVFDCLSLRDVDLKLWSFEVRHNQVANMLKANAIATNLAMVPLHIGKEAKRAEFERIKAAHGEGVVFKELDTQYTEGRPNSGGPALKFKFRDEASCLCMGNSLSGKHSARVGLYDAEGILVECGNVTVPQKHAIPEAGSVIEVIYLYKYEQGAFEQPVWKMLRDDVLADECKLSQVKRLKKKVSDRDEDDEK